MGKQLLPHAVYLGAFSLLVFIFTLVLLIAAVTLFIPNNFTFAFAFGVSGRSFVIAAVIIFSSIAVVVFLLARALQRRHTT